MNGTPSKAQKDFHEWCRGFGCSVSMAENPAIHHIKGSRMKLKGCKNPGEWYVIPLHYYYHQGYEGVHTNKRKFEEVANGTEKELWVYLISAYEIEFNKKPMAEDEYQIILERG